MILQILLYWISILGIIGVGLAVVLTKRKPVFLYFSLFSLAIASWLICQYFIDQQVAPQFWLGLGFISTELLVPAFILFVYSFPNRPTMPLRYIPWLFLPLLLFGPFSFSAQLIGNIRGSDGQFIFGALYPYQTAAVLAFLMVGLVFLIRRYKSVQAIERGQILLFLLAFIPPFLTSILTGVVYADVEALQFLRPLSVLLMSCVIVFAMVKHQLFDVRLATARTLGYLVSVIVMGTAYGFVVFGAAKYMFGLRVPLLAQIILSAATGVAALGMPYLKQRFDQVSNGLFYRDAYDVQDLFDELNKCLVSSLDISYLLKQVSSVINENIKAEYTWFGLRANRGRKYRLFSVVRRSYPESDIVGLGENISKIHQRVIVADTLDDTHKNLQRIMADNTIAVVVRLTPNVEKPDGDIGYMILGPKKSGNPFTAQDERVLDTVSNMLIIAIQNALHYEEIQKFNVTLQQRVEDATRQLKRTNARLEALDETKDDFISMASHQLRTPLTSVKGYISMVLDGDAGKVSPTQRKMLTQAFISSQRMVFLIADLLNVSRLKTGKFVIEPLPVNLSKLITEEVGQLIETAASRDIKLSYDRPAKFPLLLLDETKTRQVIMNFVDNAIYYTPSGGKIEVSLLEKPSSVELRVKDNGIGVPASEQHHLFTKFYRARNAQKARPDGTGLGLFMAKKVIAAQGGAVIFESKEGKGSTFGFTLSKTKLAVPEATPVTPEVSTTLTV